MHLVVSENVENVTHISFLWRVSPKRFCFVTFPCSSVKKELPAPIVAEPPLAIEREVMFWRNRALAKGI